MFVGAIPKSGLRITLSIAREWPESVPIQVACSGNLNFERTLAPLNRELRGNDVTLYSSALGCAAARRFLPVSVRPEHRGAFGWLQEELDRVGEDPIGVAATVVLASAVAKSVGKNAGHVYWARQIDGYRRAWPALYDKTRARYESNLPRLSEFTIGGALETLRERRGDTFAVISFPPFVQGWGYEALFKKLHELFEWPAPEYQKLDEAAIVSLLDLFTQRDYWMFAVPDRIERFDEHLAGCCATTNRGVPLWFYASNTTKRHVVTVRQHITPPRLARLGVEEEIEPPLAFQRITAGEFNALRSQHLARNIVPGSPANCFAITCGGKLIGAASIPTSGASSPTALNFAKKVGSHVYVLSDFAIAPTKYARLSKLVLTALLSVEMKAALEQDAQRRLVSIVTTAFSAKPVSMKYRGLFKLLSRKPDKDGGGFALNYAAKAGQWTLSEGFETWRRQHSQSTSKSSASTRATSNSSTTTPVSCRTSSFDGSSQM